MTDSDDISQDADYLALLDMVQKICLYRKDDPVTLLNRVVAHYQSLQALQTVEVSGVEQEDYFPFGSLEGPLLNSPFSSPYPNAMANYSNWMTSTLI